MPSGHAACDAHVGLLHAALLLRLGADVANGSQGRQWGGVASAAAIALFLVNTVASFVVPSPPKPAPGQP